MANPEQHHNLEVSNTITERLSEISSVRYPPISDNAKYISKMIASEFFVLDIVDTREEHVYPWIIDFQPRKSPIDQEMEGVILVDPIRFRSSKVDTLDAELVRTISVAVQFPDRGYCRPLREVYREALEMQKQWLVHARSSGTLHDPRYFPQSVIIQNIMGKSGYYSDFGFADWQKAIDMLLDKEDLNPTNVSKDRIRALNELLANRDSFLLSRSRSSHDQGNERRFIPEFCAKLDSLPPESLALHNAVHAVNQTAESLE